MVIFVNCEGCLFSNSKLSKYVILSSSELKKCMNVEFWQWGKVSVCVVYSVSVCVEWGVMSAGVMWDIICLLLVVVSVLHKSSGWPSILFVLIHGTVCLEKWRSFWVGLCYLCNIFVVSVQSSMLLTKISNIGYVPSKFKCYMERILFLHVRCLLLCSCALDIDEVYLMYCFGWKRCLWEL